MWSDARLYVQGTTPRWTFQSGKKLEKDDKKDVKKDCKLS
jgi:hypothetical protein